MSKDNLALIATRNKLGVALLAASSIFNLAASGEQIREVQPEDIIAAVTAAGGTHTVVRDDDGVILELYASIPGVALADESGDVDDVIRELQATGVTPSKLVGDLAQTSVTASVSFTGTLTVSSAVITTPSSTVGLVVGMTVAGTGIPAGTTITLLSPLTMSASATAAGAAEAITATGETQVIGLSEWSIDWKRKTVDATTTDDDTYESSLASTASWTVSSKYMYIDGDTSQANYILATINTAQAAVPWNFFPTIAQGRMAWTGKAYVDGIKLGSGMGKVVGLDVSLKGTGPLTMVAQATPVANSNTVTGEQAED